MGPVRPGSEAYVHPGMVLGPYELVMQVGIGGMARVWAARVRATGQVVALKMLLPELVENPAFIEMFSDEARIASRVRHENVCATYEYANYDGHLVLAMEWVDGGSLVRMLRPGPESDDERPRIPLPYRLAAKIIAEAASGLHAAHELVGDDGRSLFVVHRDVSPHNVLVTTNGEVKMTDFGVAKALGKSSVTIAGQIKGKLAYMSPEQLMGGGIDRRADVFGLGCILYETTTGEKPFRGENDPQVMAAIMIGNYDPPRSLRPDYPPELEAILVRALESDPAQRFQTAQDMRKALEDYVRKSGPAVDARQIVGLMNERIGTEISQRAHALANAGFTTNTTTAAPRPVNETGSGPGAMAVDRRSGAGSASSSAGLGSMVLSSLAGILLGLGILFYVRASWHKPKPAAPMASVTVSASATAPPVPVTSATELPPAPRVVRLKVEPEGAAVLIDGVELPAGTSSVVRPADGGVATITVRADGYDETMVIVDSATPDDVDVSLVPTTANKPKRPIVKVSVDASSAATPDLPPNPFE